MGYRKCEDFGCEINLVEQEFNSRWNKVQGISILDGEDIIEVAPLHPENGVVYFGEKGKYSPHEFTWHKSLDPSTIKFLNSDRLGKQYENDIFVGDIDKGNIYHFYLNEDRTELVLEGSLADKLADTDDENGDNIRTRFWCNYWYWSWTWWLPSNIDIFFCRKRLSTILLWLFCFLEIVHNQT